MPEFDLAKVKRHARNVLIMDMQHEVNNLEELARLVKRAKRLAKQPHTKAVQTALEKAITDSFARLMKLAADGYAGKYLEATVLAQS